ncbi:4832_t:CDS:2 [Funneliformis geosporum]|nr:4832_t:CDS:2 [Funneliformis geosporum]
MSRSNGILSPVQTNFNENSLPTKLNLHLKGGIMVFCFMIGTEIKRSFEVTGDDKMTISKLREIIYEKIKNNFKSIDANSLDLWKVDIPGDTANVKLKTLENRPHDINNENIIIKEIGGEELSPFSGFGDIFTSSSKNIHIIVQPPLFASTGNGLPLKQKQLFSSMHIIPNEVKIEIKDKVIKTFSHINAFSIDQLVDALALIWYVEAGERKTLVDVFVEYIIRLNNTSSIGNEFDAVFISVMIEKRGRRVREVLNEWKNSQEFNLPSWITPTMMVMTISNLSGGVPIVEYVENTTHYRSYAIQPDRFSGLDVVISFADDEQNVVLLSASCTISGEPINRGKIKEQVFKSCMKFQYMENPKKKNSQIEDQKEEFSWKEPEHLQIGFGDFLPSNEEVNSEEEEVDYDQDLNYDDLDYDLDYTKNTKNYRISKVSERIKNHERIKSSTENRKHIYVLVELPHRAGKRSKLFRFNKYGDLVIIVDDRNMESVFGPVIKKLMEKIHYKENQENSMNKEDLMDETE